MQQDELGVLSTTAAVINRAEFIEIDRTRVAAVAGELVHGQLRVPEWASGLHISDVTARTANYVLVLDALNFSFWGDPKWRIEYQGQVLDGYWALAGALRRAIEEGMPILEASYLEQISQPDLEYILRGEGQIPLLKQRLENLHEAGRALLRKHAGSFARAIEGADRSAVELVKTMVLDFPSFNDVARYHNSEVRFYKRAQICVADLFGAFQGKGLGRFDDMDELTAFADYKVPQMLRHLGILEYGQGLAATVDGKQPISSGSPEEVEIRAATIWGVERLRQAMAERGRPVKAFELDWYLWELSQRDGTIMKPYHRTRTVFY